MGATLSLPLFGFLLAQQGAEPLDIACHDR
jgi:hypothetical protein